MMTRTISIKMCARCNGEGIIGHLPYYGDPHDTTETCPICEGSGQVLADERGNVVGPYKRKPLITTFRPAPPF